MKNVFNKRQLIGSLFKTTNVAVKSILEVEGIKDEQLAVIANKLKEVKELINSIYNQASSGDVYKKRNKGDFIMKKEQLKKIIKEQVERVLRESSNVEQCIQQCADNCYKSNKFKSNKLTPIPDFVIGDKLKLESVEDVFAVLVIKKIDETEYKVKDLKTNEVSTLVASEILRKRKGQEVSDTFYILYKRNGDDMEVKVEKID